MDDLARQLSSLRTSVRLTRSVSSEDLLAIHARIGKRAIERLGLEKLIEEHLSDSRQGMNKQFTLADLLQLSVYSRLADYEDFNDAERMAADPTFRLISSQRISDRGAALTSTEGCG